MNSTEIESTNTKSEDSSKLNPEQIDNWRKVLFGMIGPYALMMPAEDIQKYRDILQSRAEKDKSQD